MLSTNLATNYENHMAFVWRVRWNEGAAGLPEREKGRTDAVGQVARVEERGGGHVPVYQRIFFKIKTKVYLKELI